MASVTVTTPLNIGAGILHPKNVNRFRVQYVYPKAPLSGHPHPSLNDLRVLAMQTVSVQIPDEDRDGIFMGSLLITVEDDVRNEVAIAVDAVKASIGLRIAIQKLDGNDTVLETHIFDRCSLDAIAHCKLDYRGVDGECGSFDQRGVTPSNNLTSGTFSLGRQTVTKDLYFDYDEGKRFLGDVNILEV